MNKGPESFYNPVMIEWQWSAFSGFSRAELYEILAVRQAVFTVEQACAYQDADGLDPVCWHLAGWQCSDGKRRICAYLRVVFPGKKFREPAMGRVLTAAHARGRGLGHALVRKGLEQIAAQYPGMGIRIEAQCHLAHFYQGYGFVPVSDPFDEDGIPHIEMVKHG